MKDDYLKQVDSILQHEVTRAEFLKYVGVALLGIMGITQFIKNLHKSVKPNTANVSSREAGYGKSAYGR